MRDPERIHRILGKVGQVWSLVPDWRLGQLIANVTTERLESDPFYGDPFYLEDDELEKRLDLLLEKLR